MYHIIDSKNKVVCKLDHGLQLRVSKALLEKIKEDKEVEKRFILHIVKDDITGVYVVQVQGRCRIINDVFSYLLQVDGVEVPFLYNYSYFKQHYEKLKYSVEIIDNHNSKNMSLVEVEKEG